MATRGIRLTKPERELIRRLIAGSGYAADTKVAAGILDKLALSELPVKSRNPTLSVNDAIDAFRSVLGKRLLAPRHEAIGVLSQMKNRMAALGLTADDCRTIAQRAAVEWPDGLIRAESLVRKADVFLSSERETDRTPQKQPMAAPLELTEDEY